MLASNHRSLIVARSGGKILHDAALKEAAQAFFKAAQSARCETRQQRNAAIRSGRFKKVEDVVFPETPELLALLAVAVDRSVALLGKTWHEDDIANLMWSQAGRTGIEPSVSARTFAEDVDSLSSTPAVYLTANYILGLYDGIRELAIGPVRARYTKDAAAEFNRPERPRQIVPGRSAGTSYPGDDRVIVSLTEMCWQVTVSASDRLIGNEAQWLINSATSLLRLSYPREIKLSSQVIPSVGALEAVPVGEPERRPTEIIISEGTFEPVHRQPELDYVVDEVTYDYLLKTDFFERAKSIFGAPSTQVANRIARGLGWMARGRQTADPAERLLFFFTALEALLTSDDNTTPVVQTICRNASTILTNDVNERHAIAEELKGAYRIRSGLVHGGRRSVSVAEMTYVQALAEDVYRAVLTNDATLGQKSSTFIEELAKAGFGLPWPLA